MDNAKEYQVFKKVTEDPASPEGQQLIRKFLSNGEVKSFNFSISQGERSPDYHSVDCIVFINSGKLEIGFGEQYKEKVVIEKGDFIYIAKDTPHLEHALENQAVAVVIYYTGSFQAFGA